MIVSLEKIVDRFISSYGIRTVILTKLIKENKCEISLRGGYKISVEVIDDVLYKDGISYCKVEDLFNWYYIWCIN